MDPKSCAYLDKTMLEVCCGSCGRRLAGIIEICFYQMTYREGRRCDTLHSVDRTLHVSWAYVPQHDGTWKLTKRAATRARQGKEIAVRRQQGAMKACRGGRTCTTYWCPPTSAVVDEVRPKLPLSLHCYWCNSVQILTPNKLDVTNLSIWFGSGKGVTHKLRVRSKQEMLHRKPDWVRRFVEKLEIV